MNKLGVSQVLTWSGVVVVIVLSTGFPTWVASMVEPAHANDVGVLLCASLVVLVGFIARSVVGWKVPAGSNILLSLLWALSILFLIGIIASVVATIASMGFAMRGACIVSSYIACGLGVVWGFVMWQQQRLASAEKRTVAVEHVRPARSDPRALFVQQGERGIGQSANAEATTYMIDGVLAFTAGLIAGLLVAICVFVASSFILFTLVPSSAPPYSSFGAPISVKPWVQLVRGIPVACSGFAATVVLRRWTPFSRGFACAGASLALLILLYH